MIGNDKNNMVRGDLSGDDIRSYRGGKYEWGWSFVYCGFTYIRWIKDI
jgi:hypothetical protein